MTQICLTGFADEISPDFNIQIKGFQKLGIHYMEIRGVNGRGVDTYSIPEVKKQKKQLAEQNIKISSIGSPIGKTPVEQDFGLHFEHFKHVVEIAHVMETEFIRVFSFFIPHGTRAEQYKDQVIHNMVRMAEYAKKEEVILLHENEKGIYGDTAARCAALLEAVSSSHLRAVFDPANFAQCGQDVLLAYELLEPYIAYVHIKDAKMGGAIVPAGQGDGKIPELISRLKKRGYSGFLSLEPHLIEFTGLKELEREGEASLVADVSMSGEEAFFQAFQSLKKLLFQEGIYVG